MPLASAPSTKYLRPASAERRVVALEGGEHVGGEALQLEADIEGEQVAGRDHHPHAERGEQDQHRIFGAIIAVAAEPAHRHQQRRPRRRHRSRSWRRRRSCRRRTGRRTRCRRRREAPGRAKAATASSSTASQVRTGADAVARPGGGQHQQHRADAQYLFGEDRGGDRAASVVRPLLRHAPARRARAGRRSAARRRPARRARSARAARRRRRASAP